MTDLSALLLIVFIIFVLLYPIVKLSFWIESRTIKSKEKKAPKILQERLRYLRIAGEDYKSCRGFGIALGKSKDKSIISKNPLDYC